MPTTPTQRPVLKRRFVRGKRAWIWFGVSVMGGLIAGALPLGLTGVNLLGFELGDIAPMLVVPVALLTTATLLWLTFARWIEIGADGVRVKDYNRLRFFPYREIVGGRLLIGTGRWLLEIDLRGGRSPQIMVGAIEVDDAREIMGRILEEREAFAASTFRDDVNDALGPNGRSAEVWRAEVTRLLGTDDYRRVRISVDDAFRMLDSASAPSGVRLGAAMALAGNSATLDAASRIRSVAAATVDPRLRAALEAIAEGEIDAEAIDAVIAARPRAPKAHPR